MAAVAINCLIAWFFSPWLAENILKPHGVSLRLEHTITTFLAMVSFLPITLLLVWFCLDREIVWFGRLIRAAIAGNEEVLRQHRVLVREEEHVSPFLKVMEGQLEGSLSEVEAGVLAVVERINAIYALSRGQIDSVDQSMQNAEHLPEAMLEPLRRDVMTALDRGNQEIVTMLSEALGAIQFQDVVRQRVEQVSYALNELDDHLQNVARMVDRQEVCEVRPTLKERLNGHLERYVMADQRVAHAAATGGAVVEESARPAIELF